MIRPKISVIVPVFNRVNTIGSCISGILNSAYDNVEVIIVDDGSSDNSLEVCRKIEADESRVRVYTKANGGVSSARNLGIAKASGDYITFVDSDDTLCPDALNIIASRLAEDVDLLMYSSAHVPAEKINEIAAPDSANITPIEIAGNQPLIEWVFSEYNPRYHDYYCIVVKVFNAKIIRENNIRFNEDVSLGEDQIFVCAYLKYAQSLAFVNLPLYYCLSWSSDLRAGGLSSKLRSPEEFLNNQLQNYHSIIGLYNHCGLDAVREFASDFILDRMVTRILFRHLCRVNKTSVSISELADFTAKRIKPVVDNERNGISRQNKKVLRYVLRLIASGHTKLAMLLAFVYTNAKSILQK